MNITEVRIRLINKESFKLKAVVSITIENVFVVHDIKIVEGTEGYFVTMPARKNRDGEFRDIAHPITSETREMISKMILDEFEKKLNIPLQSAL